MRVGGRVGVVVKRGWEGWMGGRKFCEGGMCNIVVSEGSCEGMRVGWSVREG